MLIVYGAHLCFTLRLAFAVNVDRPDLIGFGVSGRGLAIKDIIRREVNQNRAHLLAGLGYRTGSIGIDSECEVPFRFRAIDCRIGGAVDHEPGSNGQNKRPSSVRPGKIDL